MHVCYLALVVAPWLAIAGTLAALCGLAACGEPGQALDGGAMLALSACTSCPRARGRPSRGGPLPFAGERFQPAATFPGSGMPLVRGIGR